MYLIREKPHSYWICQGRGGTALSFLSQATAGGDASLIWPLSSSGGIGSSPVSVCSHDRATFQSRKGFSLAVIHWQTSSLGRAERGVQVMAVTRASVVPWVEHTVAPSPPWRLRTCPRQAGGNTASLFGDADTAAVGQTRLERCLFCFPPIAPGCGST